MAGHRHICQNLKFLGIDASGALQSLWTVPAHTLHRLPPGLPLDLGAMIEPLAVACHDVRLGEVKAGDYVVVLGGGPIGALIALVSRAAGARVLISEINDFRLQLLRSLGLDVIDGRRGDLPEHVESQTGGAGADVVFEVTGSAAAVEAATRLPRTRGRIVVVAIFPEPPKVDLFRLFWRELRLQGARVYEHEDFDRAIALAAAGAMPLDRLISVTYPLDQLEAGLRLLEGGGRVMKVLMKCADEEG